LIRKYWRYRDGAVLTPWPKCCGIGEQRFDKDAEFIRLRT